MYLSPFLILPFRQSLSSFLIFVPHVSIIILKFPPFSSEYQFLSPQHTTPHHSPSSFYLLSFLVFLPLSLFYVSPSSFSYLSLSCVLSGASAGSLVAAMVGTRSDDELR
jgi:hypothetical protein